MTYRRSILSSVGLLSVVAVSGCLNTLPDGIGRDGDAGRGDSQSHEIVTTYDDALATRNDATTTRDKGVTAFNERNYADAVEPLETARSGYEEAEDGFADAALSAARAARNDADAETINGHIDRFRSLREDAAAIDVADADAVASALGLD